jgi:Xaa-Pro dipeptidase
MSAQPEVAKGPVQLTEVFKDSRKAAYLNGERNDKPLRSPIPLETLRRVHAYRKRRLGRL